MLSILTAVLLMGCEKNNLVWNLPRENNNDSLQNQSPLGPGYPIVEFYSSARSVPLNSDVSFWCKVIQGNTDYRWRFYNGQPSTAVGPNVIAQFTEIGFHDVCLEGSNEVGADSLVKLGFIESYYIKSFANYQWEGWANNGWIFATTSPYQGRIIANSDGPDVCSISKSFSSVPLNAKVEFFYSLGYCSDPQTKISVKVDGVEIWSKLKSDYSDSHGESVQLPQKTSFTLTFEAQAKGFYDRVFLNDIKVRPMNN